MVTENEEAREALEERYTRFAARMAGCTVGDLNLDFSEGTNNKALMDEIMLWYAEMTEDEQDYNPPEPDWKHGDQLEG